MQQHDPFLQQSLLSYVDCCYDKTPEPKETREPLHPHTLKPRITEIAANLIHPLGWRVRGSPQLGMDSEDLKDLGHLLLLLLAVVGHLSEHHL